MLTMPSPIVSYGNNANGYWMKYENGLMDVWSTQVVTTAISSAYGSGFASPQLSLTFSQTFTAVPDYVNIQGYVNSGYTATGRVNTVAAGSATYFLDRMTTNSGATYNVTYLARGRWK